MSSPANRLEPEPRQDNQAEVDPGKLFPWLPCVLTLEVPVAGFTIGDLLNLTVGSVVATRCEQTSDIPLRVNGQLIGWTEFEVLGNRLAVRITELA